MAWPLELGTARDALTARRFVPPRTRTPPDVSPVLATVLITLFIAWLFLRDGRIRPMSSGALWLPLLWFLIIGSRPISNWFNAGLYQAPDAYTDGSPVDAAIFLALILCGLWVLRRREVFWTSVIASNRWVAAYLFFFLFSLFWSDYPYVSFKRWVKDLGNIVMVLVILSEADPTAAIRAVLARFTYVVVPLSVLFIKYWPDLGRYYHQFTWEPGYSGIATEKNALGAISFVAALYLTWDIVVKWKRAASSAPSAQPLTLNGGMRYTALAPVGVATSPPTSAAAAAASTRSWTDVMVSTVLITMTVWLLYTADSTNARLCAMFGVVVIVLSKRSLDRDRHLIRNAGVYAFIVILLGAAFYLAPGLKEGVLESLGKDPTLTGRTDIWTDVLAEPNSALFGSGYQSFWLGPVTGRLWIKYPFRPNQAHNGYIETYLNGGWIALILLLGVLISAAANVRRRLLDGQQRDAATLLAACFATTVVYCWSEAMFNKMSPIWFVLLLAVIQIPRRPPPAPSLPPTWRRQP